MKVDSQLLESRSDAAVLLEPADALLCDAAAAIGQAVEPHRRVVARRFAVSVRDHRLDLLLAEPVTDALHVVAFVAGEFAGFVPPSSRLSPTSDQGRDRLADDRLGPR